MDKHVKKKYREEFANKKTVMGILAIRNNQSGQLYLKPTLNAEAWINKSKFMLKNGLFENKELQNHWTKIGEAQFSFEMLELLKENENPFFDYQKELIKMKKEIYENLLNSNIEYY